ncbi:MAG: hypothetical protein COB46_01295 [Rhodospirillaceae bacterium]|nr:MAG: hypothetical protein COB46_01295 [Rhodospirillaceae bacterium]
MSDHAVIANSQEDLTKLWSLMTEQGPFSVWYLGGAPEGLQSIVGSLPPKAQIGTITTPLEVFADEVEDCLLDILGQVKKQVQDRLAWDVSLSSDLSPYSGTLQLNVSRYLQMHEILNTGGHHVFLLEDAEIGKALARAAQANGHNVQWTGTMENTRFVFSGLRARACALKVLWRHKRIAKHLRDGVQPPWEELKNCDCLILDWAKSTTFSSRVSIDSVSNLERMPQVLKTAGLKVGYIANPLYWLDDFQGIAQNAISAEDPVVLLEECLSFSSVLKGAWRTWRQCIQKISPIICSGRDVSALFALESLRDVQRPQPSRAYAYKDIAKTLVRKGVYPKAIIYPFENQGWERAFTAGMHKYLPDCRLIAYQHCPFSARMISFLPSKSDLLDNLPDKLIVMGPNYAQVFIDHGFPKERIVMGGSLRFEKQIKKPLLLARATGEKQMLSVLCCTSIEYDESANLVLKALRAIQGMGNVNMVVNFHPKVDQGFVDKILNMLRSFDENADDYVTASRQPASDLFSMTDVLLYNHSGAAFDTLMLGGTAIFVSVDGSLDYDKVPKSISNRVDTFQQLRKVLQGVISCRGQVEYVVDRTVGGCVAAVNEDVIVKAVTGS